ncbi:MAG: phosphate ABC transporter permease PstA [Halobacteria archaeon]|nr:phosphate ABC transporter permease PstA [Halobacteria archaeon]
MSGSEAYETELIEEEASLYEWSAVGAAALGFLVFLLSNAVILRLVDVESEILGTTVFSLFGFGLLVIGAGVVGLGLSSYLGFVETDPSQTSGIFVAAVFGLIGVLGFWIAAGSLVVGVAAGLLVAAFTAYVDEDLGSTAVPGLLSVGIGLVFVTGIIDPGWSWNPEGISVTFSATVVVPALSAFSSLLTTWTSAKAHGDFGSRGRQKGAFVLIGLNAFGMLAILLALILFVTAKGLPQVVEGAQVFPPKVPFVMNSYSILNQYNGIFPAIVGTVWLVVGAVLFSVPLGVGAAVFLTEYAEQGKFTRVVETATNGLWSTPSIVFGLFGYAFLVPRFGNTSSLLSGMIVLGFMLLPLVLITTREALKSVPKAYRDSSAALGVNKWETIKSVVLPAAMPGITTGVILGVGRIAGETAPILLVTSGQPFPQAAVDVFSFSGSFPFVSANFSELMQPSSALPYQLYAIITAGVGGNEEFGWGTAFVLLLVVLSFYAIGIVSRKYFRRKLKHE